MKLRFGTTQGLVVAFAGVGVLVGLVSCGGDGGGGEATPGGPKPIPASSIKTKAQLGKAFFFDASLSTPKGMSCGTCHVQSRAFTDPRPSPTSAGVLPGTFGFRNSPSISYMAFSPDFSVGHGEGGAALGGQFWDGRAVDLTAQARFPLLNPLEMNNPTTDAVVAAVQAGQYGPLLKKFYGASIFSDSKAAYDAVVDAIVTFEKTPEVSPFTSKYDAFLAGEAHLTASETRGLVAFNGKGGCSGCHTSSPGVDGSPPLFTNFCYANLGLPKNKNNPYYTLPPKYNGFGSGFTDIGLKLTTGADADAGNFMTPSLRNVAITAPYFHNGVFASLNQVVHFYNTRDLGGFDPPEVPETMDTTELGNLGLSAQEESDIVAFLNTLT
ncbi:MAG TPA: cytochrome c peroxidase, partial [Fimbriimonas sp.]|nr:cytochrome c peroxidase [Fimbriimonas sp.]